MEKLQQKISQAKARLLVQYPYFGTLASRLELHVNDDLESFKSDGKQLEYQEEYLEELSLDEVAFVLANGAMHTALSHKQRRQNRSGWLWQMATDIAINDMLLENGMSMPYGAQYRKRFSGMYAEEIYAELKADILRDDEDLEYEADKSDDVDSNSKEQHLQAEILNEQLLAEEAIALLESTMQKGEAPTSIERFFHVEHAGKLDWRELLKDALDPFMRDDYTLLPPSKKLLSQGIYLPSSISQTFRLVIAIDSSGSVDEVLLSTFLSEVEFLMSMVSNYVIDLLVCDEKIHAHSVFYKGEPLDVQLIGGGGTDFRPVFEYINTQLDNTQLLLYFTDLAGVFPCDSPDYDVKWIAPKEMDTPFGEVIVLEN